MLVSGGLFRLPKNGKLVPLPWFTRAPLGLKKGTAVHAALVESGSGAGSLPSDSSLSSLYRPPDLLISVLDPHAWDWTFRLQVSSPDGPGLLHDLLQEIAQANSTENHINVEIGESFTMPVANAKARWLRHHKTTLYCHLLKAAESKQIWDVMVGKLKKRHGENAVEEGPAPRPAGVRTTPLGQWMIDKGVVTLDVDWRDLASAVFQEGLMADLGWSATQAAERARRFDYGTAHAVGDLDARCIRFTFPHKGARHLHTKHEDHPNTIIRVTEKLPPDQSILGGLLAKTGATSAAFSAVCEPLPGKSSLDDAPFPELLNSQQTFREVRANDPPDHRNELYIRVPVDELSRQVSNRLKRFGERAGDLIVDLASALHHTELLAKPAGHSCAISMCRDNSVQKSAANALIETIEGRDIRVMPDIGTTSANKMIRLLRLIAADFAIFVLWANRRGSAAIEHAILYSSFYSGRQQPPAMLIVESESGELPQDVRAILPLLHGKVDVRTFVWHAAHEAAWIAMKSNSGRAWPDELQNEQCLPNEVGNWLWEQTTEF